MVAPPDDPEEPLTAEETIRFLTTADLTAKESVGILTSRDWTAEELASLFERWGKAGHATFFKAFVMLLRERYWHVHALAAFENMKQIAAELEAHPAAALSRKRKGTTSERKPWRMGVIANKNFKREVFDPAVNPSGLARRVVAWLDEQGEQHPQTRAIERWIERLRNPAAAQTR
jgi:hypothetical protein